MSKSILILILFLCCSVAPILSQNNFLNFDNTDDFVDVTQGFPSLTECTIEFWAYRQSNSNWDAVLNHDTWGLNGKIHMQFYPGDNVGFSMFGNSPTDVLTPYPSTLSEWHHVAMVYSSTNANLKVYIDGVLITDLDYTTALVPASGIPFEIGNWSNSRPFDGNLDELKIWDYALTETEINNQKDMELKGDEAGLIAYYNFNEGDCASDNAGITSLIDVTGNGYDGVPTNFLKDGCTSNWICGGATCSVPDNGVLARVAVPTLSQWGLVILSLLFLIFGVASYRRNAFATV